MRQIVVVAALFAGLASPVALHAQEMPRINSDAIVSGRVDELRDKQTAPEPLKSRAQRDDRGITDDGDFDRMAEVARRRKAEQAAAVEAYAKARDVEIQEMRSAAAAQGRPLTSEEQTTIAAITARVAEVRKGRPAVLARAEKEAADRKAARTGLSATLR